MRRQRRKSKSMTKIPIAKQCASLRLLIRSAETGVKMKKAEIDHLRPHWDAACESLTWLSLNETKIKEALRHGVGNQPVKSS